ncbi:MAG: SixA phosphatase family protein [bacterium]
MKTVTFMRHGKSSWEYDVSDDRRPLKKRGQREAKLVAKRFNELNDIKVDLIISSYAKRAHDTCKIYCDTVGFSIDQIEVNDRMYDFSGNQVLEIIKGLDNSVNHVMLFGHNYAFTSLVNLLGSTYIENVPTAGLVSISFNNEDWKNLGSGITKYTIFPKDLR